MSVLDTNLSRCRHGSHFRVSLCLSHPHVALNGHTALPRRLRLYWIEGELGNCDWELEDLKACFWLRVNEREAEAWESKLRRARQLEKPPPPSANGTVWPARATPPAAWAHPGSGLPDDEDAAQSNLLDGASKVPSAVPPTGWTNSLGLSWLGGWWNRGGSGS